MCSCTKLLILPSQPRACVARPRKLEIPADHSKDMRGSAAASWRQCLTSDCCALLWCVSCYNCEDDFNSTSSDHGPWPHGNAYPRPLAREVFTGTKPIRCLPHRCATMVTFQCRFRCPHPSPKHVQEISLRSGLGVPRPRRTGSGVP